MSSDVDVDELFLPFIRDDRYGELGLAPQPLAERIRLVLMTVFVVPFKVIFALLTLVSYYLVVRLSFLYPALRRSDWLAALGKVHCRVCLFFIGFTRISWVSVAPESLTGKTEASPAAIISNHSSWTDVLVHMSHSFPAFVARQATEAAPLIGIIRRVLSCLAVHTFARGKHGLASTIRMCAPLFLRRCIVGPSCSTSLFNSPACLARAARQWAACTSTGSAPSPRARPLPSVPTAASRPASPRPSSNEWRRLPPASPLLTALCCCFQRAPQLMANI
jgi:hypothetical protein